MNGPRKLWIQVCCHHVKGQNAAQRTIAGQKGIDDLGVELRSLVVDAIDLGKVFAPQRVCQPLRCLVQLQPAQCTYACKHTVARICISNRACCHIVLADETTGKQACPTQHDKGLVRTIGQGQPIQTRRL